MDNEKHADESWKETVDKDKASEDGCGEGCDCGQDHGEEMAVNFLTYLTSMGYQAMIFMGEVPHPATNQLEKNLRQAKFLIDTLLMLRDKTKGNLSEQEESFLGGTLYELQMKFVEISKKESGKA